MDVGTAGTTQIDYEHANGRDNTARAIGSANASGFGVTQVETELRRIGEEPGR